MAAQKRALDDSSSTQRAKKPRAEGDKTKGKNKSSTNGPAATSLATEEVDFPRGGGTSFTPHEVKAIRAEAVKEANAELFKVCKLSKYSAMGVLIDNQEDSATKNRKNKKKKGSDAKASTSTHASEGKDKIRIEHLNYKVWRSSLIYVLFDSKCV